MKIKSEIDLWVRLLLWGTILILLGSILFFPDEFKLVMMIFTLPVVCLLLWIYYGTYYVFREDHLFCRSGPFFERIKYDQIKSLKLSENMLSSMALARKRIEIKQH